MVYHLGCMFEYAIGVYDGARVFPVHGAWYVTVSILILHYLFLSIVACGESCVWEYSAEGVSLKKSMMTFASVCHQSFQQLYVACSQ